MPRRPRLAQTIRDVDDIIHILTGRRIPHFAHQAYTLFTQEKSRQKQGYDPYRVLQVHPGASMVVVNAAYKSLAKLYHPDSGTTPNVEMMKEINQAYDEIKRQRSNERVDQKA